MRRNEIKFIYAIRGASKYLGKNRSRVFKTEAYKYIKEYGWPKFPPMSKEEVEQRKEDLLYFIASGEFIYRFSRINVHTRKNNLI